MNRQLRRQAQRHAPSVEAYPWLLAWWESRRAERPREVINLDKGPGNYTLEGLVPWPQVGPSHTPRDPNLGAVYVPTVRDPQPAQLEEEFRRAHMRGLLRDFAVGGGLQAGFDPKEPEGGLTDLA